MVLGKEYLLRNIKSTQVGIHIGRFIFCPKAQNYDVQDSKDFIIPKLCITRYMQIFLMVNLKAVW
jgi:hypothetical protein